MKKRFDWDEEKNQWLIHTRDISFEAVVSYIEEGNIIAIIPGKGKFHHQKQFVLAIDHYIYIVPFVEDEEKLFLKTIIPSRKLTKRYLENEDI